MGRNVSARKAQVDKRQASFIPAEEHGWVKDTYRKAHPIIGAIRRHIVTDASVMQYKRDWEHLHPSEVCDPMWCPRRSQYRMMGTPMDERSDPSYWWRLANIYEEGHYIHAKYQNWLWEMGVLEGDFKCEDCHHVWWALAPAVCERCASVHIQYAEVPIQLADMSMIGHADGIVNMDGKRTLIEIKSIGLRSFEFEKPIIYQQFLDHDLDLVGLWNAVKQPFPKHLKQAMLYLRDVGPRLGVEELLFIYEFKANQDVKGFSVSYREKSVERIVTNSLAVVEAIDTGGMVKRPHWAENPDVSECKSCPYRTTCWKL